jgi:hypothetical protein
MAEPLTLDAVLEDLQAIEPLILNYEKTYKVLTPYFIKLYRAGKLEENWDFIDWAGLYEIKLRREKAYRELVRLARTPTGPDFGQHPSASQAYPTRPQTSSYPRFRFIIHTAEFAVSYSGNY